MGTTIANCGGNSESQGTQALGRSGMDCLTAEFNRYYGLVYRYLLHRFFDKDQADELAAQTFYQAANHPESIPQDGRQIEFWLMRIATNLANTHCRRLRWRRVLLDRFRRVRTDQARRTDSDPDQRAQDVRRAITALSPKDQTVIVLRYFNHNSFEDIAAILRCRPDAVRTRLSRAVGKLRTLLATHD